MFFRNFCLFVAMVTNQIKRLKQKWYGGRGQLKEHLCKSFVKISAMR